MAAVSAARNAAYRILLAVDRGHGHSDDLLRAKAVTALSVADRGLATTLVMGVLRWQIDLDRRLQAFLTRPNTKIDAEVRVALRMGAFQLLHLDRIPARAAIDESVELSKQAGHRFAAGMINAVLRKLAATAASSRKEDLGVAAEHGHPAWMVDRWVHVFGSEQTRAICSYGQAQPTATIRLNYSTVEAELKQAGISIEAGRLLTAARRVTGGDVSATAAFKEGRVRFQDEGSQLVAEIAAHCAKDAKAILDCCAAPGGKTLILAERKPGIRIVACESSLQRLEQLKKRIAANEQIECRLADAAVLTEQSEFDLVLADAPCSGTGTLGRNPEIRHRLHVADFERQAERQKAILGSALRAVRVGGRVVYSTCSLEPEENEQVVASVLRDAENARIVPLSTIIDELRGETGLTDEGAGGLRESLTPEGFLRLFPGVLDTDGFFIAVIEKNT